MSERALEFFQTLGFNDGQVGAAAMGVRRLLGKFIYGVLLSIQWTAHRASPLVVHGQPFQSFDAGFLMKLEPAHVVGAQHLGAGDEMNIADSKPILVGD